MSFFNVVIEHHIVNTGRNVSHFFSHGESIAEHRPHPKVFPQFRGVEEGLEPATHIGQVFLVQD
jgi:hypothetical protein